MDCPVCCRKWDLKEVRPKVLPCSHSLCVSCLRSLNGRQCPQCRKTFPVQLKDNFALVACLEVLEQERPQVSWWCMDCQADSTARCMDQHDVRRPRAALRQALQDLVPRASQDLQALFGGLHGPQDGEQVLQDSAAMTALVLIRDVPTACKLTLSQNGGMAFGADWYVDGQEHAEDVLLKSLVVALAANGHLHQKPMEVHEEVQSAASVPLEGRIADIDLGSLSKSQATVQRNEKAKTLRQLGQRGVVRISNLYCDYDPTWSLNVLQSVAPTVEDLHVKNPLKAHLLQVHTMPRLQRLDLVCHYRSKGAQGDDEYALPDMLYPLPQPSRLKSLRLEFLPRATAQSLLTAHCASLDVLWLEGRSDDFRDIDVFLGGLGLRISKLVLDMIGHNPIDCREPVAAAGRALRGCTIQCKACCCVPEFW